MAIGVNWRVPCHKWLAMYGYNHLLQPGTHVLVADIRSGTYKFKEHMRHNIHRV